MDTNYHSMNFSVTQVEKSIHILEKALGLPGYEYDFTKYFTCNHPIYWDGQITAIARIGATNDYPKRYHEMLEHHIRLIHTPDEYLKTSFLPHWYPIIKSYTPRSRWYDTFPSLSEIEKHFNFPIFIKGERQTNRHARNKSIINNSKELDDLKLIWVNDPILHWQKIVIREFISLELVIPDNGIAMPKALEFRTFWWKNNCVSIGNYWTSEQYSITASDKTAMLHIAQKAATLIDVSFLVIDMAKTKDGNWIVIELNDGQDAGYSGNNPFLLWNNILKIESMENE